MVKKWIYSLLAVALMGCGSNAGTASASASDSSADADAAEKNVAVPSFFADSAYLYLKRQMDFGPRVPNSEAHRRCADWLVAELRRHGAEVIEQKADLKAFDGTTLHARNIFGSFNPDMQNRLLLLAHYDTRPWADEDPDPANHKKPVPGANDGASGVAVLLEAARAFAAQNPGKGIDILFVDAEDYGTKGDEDSWALGAQYFANNPIKEGYRPAEAVLLDMVGGRNATFPAEYFSRQAAPVLDDRFRAAAARAGHAEIFPQRMGGAITDDHVQLINQGIPAIDIIEYIPEQGFNPTWHTVADDLPAISKETLGAVGESLMHFIYE